MEVRVSRANRRATRDRLFSPDWAREARDGDMDSALMAAQRATSESVNFDELKRRKALLQEHKAEEKMTDEGLANKRFRTLEMAKKAFELKPEVLADRMSNLKRSEARLKSTEQSLEIATLTKRLADTKINPEAERTYLELTVRLERKLSEIQKCSEEATKAQQEAAAQSDSRKKDLSLQIAVLQLQLALKRKRESEEIQKELEQEVFVQIAEWIRKRKAAQEDIQWYERAKAELTVEVEELKRKIWGRAEFIDANPHEFLKIPFYTEDPYGVKNIGDGLGSGQVITIIEEYKPVIPRWAVDKCVNLKDVVRKHQTTSEHGWKVASVAVHPQVGLAKDAKFFATDLVNLLPSIDVASNLDKPGCLVVKGPALTRADIQGIISKMRDSDQLCFQTNGKTYSLDFSKTPVPAGLVVNMSFEVADSITKRNQESSTTSLMYLATVVYRLCREGKLIVWCAGNESTVLSASTEYSLKRSLAEALPTSILLVSSLKRDAMTLARHTNQPGLHQVAFATLCAPGHKVEVFDSTDRKVTGSGTSYATPFVAAAAAILAGRFPEATAKQIIKALLESATPIVMYDDDRYIDRIPVVLIDVTAGQLKEGLHQYRDADGRIVDIFVTLKMIARGIEKYGRGRLNVKAALNYLDAQLQK